MKHHRHITLHGGPPHLNRKIIADHGTVQIRIIIFRKNHELNCGTAIYEPAPTRRIAYFRETIWDGKHIPIS